jgi:hypothetical protein
MEGLTNFFQNMFLYFYKQSGYMFYLLDILYQKINIEDEEDKEDLINLYDIENDIIKVQYLIENCHNYIFCFDRKDDINIKEIYEELIQSKENQGYLMYAELNNKDVTERLNKHLGPEGCHLNYNKFKIKWFLDNYEIENFEKLSIIDSMGNEKEYKNLNDFLKLN